MIDLFINIFNVSLMTKLIVGAWKSLSSKVTEDVGENILNT